MIFFKKVFVVKNLKNNNVCGHGTITKGLDCFKVQIKCLNLTENEQYEITFNSEGANKLQKTVFGKELSNFEFNFQEKNENLNNFSATICEQNKINNSNLNGEANKQEKQIYNLSEKTIPPNTETRENFEDDTTFYSLVKLKVEKAFENNPELSSLNAKFENSKWVKVEFDQSGLFYALGIINGNDKVKYICYGIPSNKEISPPKHLKNFCNFTQTSENGDGFYIMMQNAEDGSPIT